MGFSPLQNLALQEKLSDQEKVNRQLQTERQEREMELKQEVGQVTIDSPKTVASTEVKKTCWHFGNKEAQRPNVFSP